MFSFTISYIFPLNCKLNPIIKAMKMPRKSSWHILYFLDYKMHFPPSNLAGKWGCILKSKCSLHLHWWNIMLLTLWNILPHFLLQNFFSYFPSLKPRCIFWSEKCGIFFKWRIVLRTVKLASPFYESLLTLLKKKYQLQCYNTKLLQWSVCLHI